MFSGENLERMELIRKIINEVEKFISYQISCFEFFSFLIYYSTFSKHFFCLHLIVFFLEHFKLDLKGYKTSKFVIHFFLTNHFHKN